MFTSTLSVAEFAVLADLQALPLTQVMGVSVQQIGWQYLPPEAQWSGSELFCELDRVAHAWDQARRQAFDGMAQEALAAGADAVVGVHLHRGDHDLGARTVEFLATGTAVRWSGERRAQWPALTALSAQDYWKLHSAGWSAVGVAASTAVFFVSQSFFTRWQRRTTFASNQELTEFSDGFSNARHAAVRYLRSQAESAGGDGVVGVSLEHTLANGSFKVMPNRGYQPQQSGRMNLAIGESAQTGSDERSGMVITIQATGTAIRLLQDVRRYPPETTIGASA